MHSGSFVNLERFFSIVFGDRFVAGVKSGLAYCSVL
jgi:hypothetical protein